MDEDVGEQHPAGAGRGCQATDVAGVEMVRPGLDRVGAVRSLGEERVARPDERTQVVRGSACLLYTSDAADE